MVPLKAKRLDMDALVHSPSRPAWESSILDKKEKIRVDSASKYRICVFGIGYVGTVSAACLARDGHDVVAVDVNQDKVNVLNRGQSPIVEPNLAESIGSGVSAGRLKATTDSAAAVSSTDISLVCVGT